MQANFRARIQRISTLRICIRDGGGEGHTQAHAQHDPLPLPFRLNFYTPHAGLQLFKGSIRQRALHSSTVINGCPTPTLN
ncbi:MAG: hypothetical protein ABI120_14505 [Gemmatimonadaceae bacterium]